jgi:predicted metalloprotease with PDZ domain
MRSYSGLLLFLSLPLLYGCASTTRVSHSGPPASISYRVSIPDTAAEEFAVAATLTNVTEDTVVFQFPIWAPGAYDIVNFGAYVHDFTARDTAGRPMQVIRGDTSTFRIIGRSDRIALDYRVHDIERVKNSMWFCISDIEPEYAFAVGVALFGYPVGYKDAPCSVVYTPPAGWSVAVALDSAGAPNSFRARDYDELVDVPVQMGHFRTDFFTVDGRPHEITTTMFGTTDTVDRGRIVRMTDTVVRLVSGFFGDMPYSRYLFQLYLEDPRRGGHGSLNGALEHRNSSTYLMPYFPGMILEPNLAPVIAHEYWHLWSPKLFHVKQLGPFDYQSPPRTASLWFGEGLTEYYARVLLLRGGLTTEKEFLKETEEDLGPLYGHGQQRPITELSMKISELPIFESIALYSTGPMIGLLLDGAIRSQTGNRKSLDDAMRYFNREYGKTGTSFTDEEIIPIIERATGAHLADFYNRYIAGHDPLPFDEYLPKMGLKYAAESEKKRGLAADLEDTSEGWLVTGVVPGGSADSMGLQVGDVITQMYFKSGTPLGVTHTSVSIAEIYVTLPDFRGVTVRRGGAEIRVPAKIVESVVQVRHLQADPAATGLAAEIRRSMLGF